MKRGDLIQEGETKYIVAQMDDGLMAWDYEAWAEGYYDAYRPIDDAEDKGYGESLWSKDITILGNIYDNPELLPAVCEGYNGEPNVVVIETLWKNPDFIAEGER